MLPSASLEAGEVGYIATGLKTIRDVAVGDTVQVEIDALPDVELQGTVTNIKPFGVNVLGDITYKVTVRLGTSDPRLRWNMTAAVTITP